MKIKQPYLLTFLLISSLAFSCNKKQYTANDMVGKYWLYSSYYGGLIKKKVNAYLILNQDSNLVWQGCTRINGKWYIQESKLFLSFIISEDDSINSVANKSFPIANNKFYEYNVPMTYSDKSRTDTFYKDYVYIKEH